MFKNPDNKNEVLEVVKEKGYLLMYASNQLIDDEEVVLEAVKQNGYSLNYASEGLKNNKEFIYTIKDIILENKDKDFYQQIYQNLLNYEREDELNHVIKDKSSIHKKINYNYKKRNKYV